MALLLGERGLLSPRGYQGAEKTESIAGLTGNAEGFDAGLDGIELFVGGFLKTVCGRLAVDGVDHHLTGRYLADGLQPGLYILIARIVHIFAVAVAAHEHGLNDEMAVEGLHALNDLSHVVGARWVVDARNIMKVYGVELQDVVVHPHQGIVDGLAVDHRGIAQYGDFRLRAVLVTQADDIVDDLREVGMTGGLTIASKGQHVRQLTFGSHLLQLLFQLGGHLFACGEGQGRTVVFVETALAVDAVERTHLAVGRQQVDT